MTVFYHSVVEVAFNKCLEQLKRIFLKFAEEAHVFNLAASCLL